MFVLVTIAIVLLHYWWREAQAYLSLDDLLVLAAAMLLSDHIRLPP